MRILFALGMVEMEDYIKDCFKNNKDYLFVGACVHKDAIVQQIKALNPDILIIREGIQGKDNIFKLIYDIKFAFPNIRIIFLAGEHENKAIFGRLVSIGIYDIIEGNSITIDNVIESITKPKDIAYARQFLPQNADSLISEDDYENEEVSDEKVDENEKVIAVEDIKEVPNKKEPEKKESLIDKYKKTEKTSKDLDLEKKLKEQEKLIKELQKEKESNKENKEDKDDKKEIGLTFLKNIRTNKTQNIEPHYYGKDKIITFLGVKRGIGTTLLSFNTAIELASRKNKVLYIEFSLSPMIPYWLDVFSFVNSKKGLDKAILGVETNNYNDMNNNIIKIKELMNPENDLIDSLKKYPNTLDLMFFSADYLNEEKSRASINPSSLNPLLTYYLQTLDYNYIIIDVNIDIDSNILENLLTFSTNNYIICNQEFSSLSYYSIFNQKLVNKGLNLSNKNTIILNNYIAQCKFNENSIKDFLETKNILTVPSDLLNIYDLSSYGKPIVKETKNKEFKTKISDIANNIER